MIGDAAGGTFACPTLAPQAPQNADASFNMVPQFPQNLAIALLYLLRAARISVCQREYANTAVPQSGRRSFRLRSAGSQISGGSAGARLAPPRGVPDATTCLPASPSPGPTLAVPSPGQRSPNPNTSAPTPETLYHCVQQHPCRDIWSVKCPLYVGRAVL